MSTVCDPVPAIFATELRRRLGSNLREIRLFGSRARGDARQDSDYDMLVVVGQRSAGAREQILDLEVEILDRHQALIATVLRSEQEWARSQGQPLARNVAREGIRL